MELGTNGGGRERGLSPLATFIPLLTLHSYQVSSLSIFQLASMYIVHFHGQQPAPITRSIIVEALAIALLDIVVK